ncbi:MAG TPA: WhiB family transcriptional regulator [Micromonosporaceae bacterium]
MSDVRRLPRPITELWEWQRLGACRGRDSAQFFHPEGERGFSRLHREVRAKSVCVRCPVRAECAAHALSVREPYGVWGGFSESERLRLLALGWEDLASHDRRRVDVAALEARLRAALGGRRSLPAQRGQEVPSWPR